MKSVVFFFSSQKSHITPIPRFDKDASLSELVGKRYESFDTEIGAQIECLALKDGKADFKYLEREALEFGELRVPSAKQRARSRKHWHGAGSNGLNALLI
ncbi:xylose isomerase-like isoform X2 [Apium graveolens]|uniref:xylose isomerase-like isoform X2 n=1 Tax=Apium graveolens TaxID=4045 RepID=UPI003D7BEDC5